IADVLRVEQRPGAVGAAGDVPTLPPVPLEGEGPAEIPHRLVVIFPHLSVKGHQEPGRLPEDGDDPGVRVEGAYLAGRRMRGEIPDGSLPDQLIGAGSGEQVEVLVQVFGERPRTGRVEAPAEVSGEKHRLLEV